MQDPPYIRRVCHTTEEGAQNRYELIKIKLCGCGESRATV